MKEYKVDGEHFSSLQDARDYAEELLYGLPYDGAIYIDVRDGEDFFEPYGRLIRKEGKPVLER